MIWHDGVTLTRQMQLAQDFPEKFVQDVLGVFAAEVNNISGTYVECSLDMMCCVFVQF